VAATMAATGGEPRLLQRIEIVGDRRRVHDAAFRDVVVAAPGLTLLPREAISSAAAWKLRA
jgi:hypothetical protein